jgi:hypothetical protein
LAFRLLLRRGGSFAESAGDPLAEDVLVVGVAVAGALRQQLGIAVADAVRGLLVVLAGLAALVGGKQTFQIDDFPDHARTSRWFIRPTLSILTISLEMHR